MEAVVVDSTANSIVVEDLTGDLETVRWTGEKAELFGAASVAGLGVYGAATGTNRLGQYYCWNRTYDVNLGRWTTPDPVATPWWNLVGFTSHSPALSVDPRGLQEQKTRYQESYGEWEPSGGTETLVREVGDPKGRDKYLGTYRKGFSCYEIYEYDRYQMELWRLEGTFSRKVFRSYWDTGEEKYRSALAGWESDLTALWLLGGGSAAVTVASIVSVVLAFMAPEAFYSKTAAGVAAVVAIGSTVVAIGTFWQLAQHYKKKPKPSDFEGWGVRRHPQYQTISRDERRYFHINYLGTRTLPCEKYIKGNPLRV
ncbi:MAG: hypothetical protein LC130_26370 [Bryobacterales bacterium]|nr:hypothetical protein [Bryobacterales bacterium]